MRVRFQQFNASKKEFEFSSRTGDYFDEIAIRCETSFKGSYMLNNKEEEVSRIGVVVVVVLPAC